LDVADSPPPPDPTGSAGLVSGLARALAVLLGLHLQHAQQEASNDAGRLVAGVWLLAAGTVFALLGIAVGELGAAWAIHHHLGLDWLRTLLLLAGADLLLGLLLVLWARAKLRKPLLQQTRELLRRTVAGLIDH
jgi:glycerol dehydrogenase-like iron-containing ADH family enzyme